MNYYILDQNNEPKEANLDEWHAWNETNPKIGVEYSAVGPIAVGTEFIGGSMPEARTFWQTKAIGPQFQYQERCGGNREQARAMHAKVVKMIRDRQKQT